MQLFSIGLWQLNPDGTRQLDGQSQPIPTYNNGDIEKELARVFTGLSFGNNANFSLYPRDFTVPMKGWDSSTISARRHFSVDSSCRRAPPVRATRVRRRWPM